jgi:hypothetical protein
MPAVLLAIVLQSLENAMVVFWLNFTRLSSKMSPDANNEQKKFK